MAIPSGFGRRAFLTAAGMMLAAGLPLRAAASNATGPRLAAIDWAMLETAIALGHMPVGACELVRYRDDTPVPQIPQDVTDLGLRGAPNFELLQLIRPDLILTSPYYARYEGRLAQLAPVLNLPFYNPGEPPLPKIITALHQLGDAIGDPGAAQRANQQLDERLAALAQTLTPYRDRPVCLVNIGDARHMRAFGFDSLFGSTLDRLGLANGWNGKTRFSFLAPVPIEELVNMPETRLVIVGKVPLLARRSLQRSVLWRALPPVAEKRLYLLDEVNAFGGTPSALRFAELLAQALASGPVASL